MCRVLRLEQPSTNGVEDGGHHGLHPRGVHARRRVKLIVADEVGLDDCTTRDRGDVNVFRAGAGGFVAIHGVECVDVARDGGAVSTLGEWRHTPVWNRDDDHVTGATSGESDGARKESAE